MLDEVERDPRQLAVAGAPLVLDADGLNALATALVGRINDVGSALIGGMVAGAVIGTKLLHVLPHRTLGLLFSGLLIVSAGRLFVSTDADSRAPLTAAAAAVT